jgi:hypothetical protein
VSPLDIVLCWPSWIDGVSVGHCTTETPSIQEGQHNTISNGDAVNPRRPTKYNVQRRYRQSKMANTIQCLMETPSCQEGQHNTRPTQCNVQHRVGLLGLTASPLEIVVCWPSWIDGVCVHSTMSNADAVNARRPTYYYVQRRCRQSK